MQNFVNYYGYTIKAQNAIYLPAGEGKVSFVDVRDVAAVAAKLLLTKIMEEANMGIRLAPSTEYRFDRIKTAME
jgi:uncharacterized protein YbjT (DUF2867 family)